MNNNAMNSPFRKCDYCRRGDRAQDADPRFSRRAWTLFNNSRKLACPECERQGRIDDQLVLRLILRFRPQLDRRLLADPVTVYGDAPLRCTHLVQFKGSAEWVAVHLMEGRYYGLSADWDIPVNDRRLHRVVRISQHRTEQAA